MNQLSQKERHIILISILLSITGLLFQNCNKKLTSQALLKQSSLVEPEEFNPPPQPISKTIECEVPLTRATKLSSTCLPQALEKIRQVGELDNFIEFEPQYPLYSDGAGKRRWIYLPPGSKIDSSDGDFWKYPKGTILFKEFSMDGQVIETRMIEKIGSGNGDGNWRFSMFAYRKDEMDSDRLDTSDLHTKPDELADYKASLVADRYNIGSFNTCTSCHSRTGDVVRGFGYLQLSNLTKTVNLDYIANKNWLTVVPTKFDEIPGNAIQKQAVGYIQSNCATCHDGGGFGPGNFRHLSTSTNFTDEPFYATTQEAIRSDWVIPGNAAGSKIVIRMHEQRMPKIPLFNKDTNGISSIEAWINQL